MVSRGSDGFKDSFMYGWTPDLLSPALCSSPPASGSPWDDSPGAPDLILSSSKMTGRTSVS